jgi:hypothetical protein
MKPNKFLFLIIWSLMSVVAAAQDRAERLDVTELISSRGEYSELRKSIGFNKLGDLKKYDLIVIIYSDITNAKALAFEKLIEVDVDPFSEKKPIIKGYKISQATAVSDKISQKDIDLEEFQKVVISAWKLIENVEIGIQKKNLESMKSFHDEVYVQIFCKDPKQVNGDLYGGVLINPIKQTPSGLFLSEMNKYFDSFIKSQ